MDFQIQQIDAEFTWPIRQYVLWPDQPISHCMLEDDAIGTHYGVFVDGRLVSVASLFPQGAGVLRLRKFATLPDYQHLGMGTALLKHIIADVPKQGISRVWCHAWATALPFYARFGFVADGEPFNKGPVSYVRAELVL